MSQPDDGSGRRTDIPAGNAAAVNRAGSTTVKADFAVIGAGLVGASIAWGLARGGAKVVVLDAGEDRLHASAGNFGLVWVQGKGAEEPAYARLTRRSADAWAAFAEELSPDGDLQHQQCGGVKIALSEEELASFAAHLERYHNHPDFMHNDTQIIDARDLRELIPCIGPTAVGGTWCPHDGHADSLATVTALHRRLAGHPRIDIVRARVDSVKTSSAGTGFTLRAGASRVSADRVVLAAGLGSRDLAGSLGLEAPLRPERGQILVTERAPAFLDVACHTMRQTSQGTILLGDSKEDVGMNTGVTQEVTQAILARAVRMFPHLAQLRLQRSWGALRVLSPDGLPIYQSSETCPGAALISCHSGVTLAAALAESALRVRLIDEQIGPGGQIWRNTNPPHCWPGVNYSLASTLVDIELDDLPSVTWLQRKGPARIMHHTRARALILATGAMERPLLFPGCQLPGVMGVGAMQIMLKQAGLVPGGPGVIVAGQGPLMLLALQQVIARGGSVDAVLDLSDADARTRAARKLPQAVAADPRLLLQGLQLLRAFRQMKIPVYKHVTALRAMGDGHVEEVQFESGGRNHTMPARLLAVHDGVLPATQITRLLNLVHRWDERQQAFLPVTAVDGAASDPRIWVTGDAAGVMGAELASLRGRLTGLAVASTLRTGTGQRARAEGEAQDERRIRRRMPARHFVDELYRPLPVDHLATDDTIVCRCESISLKSIRDAMAIGASGPNRVKLFTRCGMGACQGRQCGTALTRIIARETGRSCDEIGALRIRPPLKPTLIGDYTGDAT